MEILIHTNNGIIDITNIALEKLTIRSFLQNNPTKMQTTLVLQEKIAFFEGDVVSIKYKGKGIFLGYIFTKKIENNLVTITAYDQIRYLINRDTYIYTNKTASQILKLICSEFSIKTNTIEDTKYIIPYRIEENQTILDIIYTALDLTETFNNKKYVLYDNFGKIELKSYEKMKLPILIDCTKNVINYIHTTSIDKNVYNSIKVSIKNKKTKVISTYIEEDKNNKKKWGTLRLFNRLPNDFTSIQAKNYAKNLLSIKNKLNEKIEIIFLYEDIIRAGNLINILIDKDTIKTMAIEECTYIINNNEIFIKAILCNI